jgi:hypothetical protein
MARCEGRWGGGEVGRGGAASRWEGGRGGREGRCRLQMGRWVWPGGAEILVPCLSPPCSSFVQLGSQGGRQHTPRGTPFLTSPTLPVAPPHAWDPPCCRLWPWTSNRT